MYGIYINMEYTLHIQCIYYVYTGQDVIYQLYIRNIHGIYHMVYTMYKHVYCYDIHIIQLKYMYRVYTWYIQSIYMVYTEYKHNIYWAYTWCILSTYTEYIHSIYWYIPCLYWVYTKYIQLESMKALKDLELRSVQCGS